MKIEILFPEFCNLYGDISNMAYLKKCLPNEEYIETAIDEEPTFITTDVDFIYLGAMTENMQEKVIKKLLPYKARIEELIEKNVVFLLHLFCFFYNINWSMLRFQISFGKILPNNTCTK